MLTPAKIKNHSFEASGRNAYKADSVDDFFEEVAQSYEQMFRENGEMYKKIGLLAERLEEYRKDEDNIRNALLTAQRMAEKVTREAQEKVDSLLAETEEKVKAENDRIEAVSKDTLQKANYQAQSIVNDAQREADRIIAKATENSRQAAAEANKEKEKEEAALKALKEEVARFKDFAINAYKEQLELIEKLPDFAYEKVEAEKENKVAEPIKPTEEIKPEQLEKEEPSAAQNVYFSKELNDFEPLKTVDESEVEEHQEVSEGGFPADIEAIDEKIERLSREIAMSEAEGNKFVKDSTPDIPFSERSSKKKENGFKVNFENVEVYDDDDDEYDSDEDEEEDKPKFKGFFRK